MTESHAIDVQYWIVLVLLFTALEVFKKQFILPHFESFRIAPVNLK